MTKLIFACDVSDLGLGPVIIDRVAPHVDAVKVGLEAMTAEDGEGRTLAYCFRDHARERHNLDVMWDMKLHDIVNTTRNAARNIVKHGSKFFTLHATASDAALAAAAEAAGDKAMALAVTVLTDLDEDQCVSRYVRSSSLAVKSFAKNAYRLGIKGFLCSAREAGDIRETVPSAYIATPGIRPLWSVTPDEQQRVTTPTHAKRAGVDAIIVGRPIYKPPPGMTEDYAARCILQELAAA